MPKAAAEKAKHHEDKYRKMMAEKRNGTWIDDKVVMKLPEGF